jgi:hypothetical protein
MLRGINECDRHRSFWRLQYEPVPQQPVEHESMGDQDAQREQPRFRSTGTYEFGNRHRVRPVFDSGAAQLEGRIVGNTVAVCPSGDPPDTRSAVAAQRPQRLTTRPSRRASSKHHRCMTRNPIAHTPAQAAQSTKCRSRLRRLSKAVCRTR